LKILFPFVGDSVGGSHVSTLELYSSLIDVGVSAVIVLHEGNGPLSKYLNKKNIPFSILKSSKLAGTTPGKASIFFGMLSNFFNFGMFIKKNKIDIVHGNDLRINLSWSLPAKFFGRGFVWHQRTLLSDSKFWLLIKYLCNYFVSISDVVMQSSPKNILNSKKKIIYNPFDVDCLENKQLERASVINKYDIPHDCFLLGCVGRIVDYKNVDFLIKNIFDIYNNFNKKVFLVIVGTGEDKYINKLKQYTYQLDISHRVVFTGFVNNSNRIISSLDLLVAPSQTDAFGRTIVESMLQKTPVLAAGSGGHPEIIKDKVNGMLYDPDMKNDLFKKICIVINKKNINVQSNRAYKLAKSRFSSKQHRIHILEIYEYLLIK
jgi:glycosyltransferase involved in cell wall biosynthesis